MGRGGCPPLSLRLCKRISALNVKEAVTTGVLKKSCSEKFRNIHRKTPVSLIKLGVFIIFRYLLQNYSNKKTCEGFFVKPRV